MEMKFILVCGFSLCLLGLVAFGCVISQHIMVLGRASFWGRTEERFHLQSFLSAPLESFLNDLKDLPDISIP